jgi:Xaa-Pro aminopeptidase
MLESRALEIEKILKMTGGHDMHNPDNTIPQKEIENRIANLQCHLRDQAIDGALILQKSDLYYFSGTIQQGHLYVPADGTPLLMVHKSVQRARVESRLDQIVPLDSPRQIPELLAESGIHEPAVLGLELDVLPANTYLGLRKIFNGIRICDISHPIRLVRAVKSAYEIVLMRQAANFADQVAASVKPMIEEGMTEIELAGKIEAVARRLGHQGIVRMRLWGSELFYGHLMSGPAAAVPSYLSSPTGGSGVSPAVAQSAGFKKIKSREPILVDYVFVYQGYLADHARIFALKGLPEELVKAHDAMISIQNRLMDEIKPGLTGADVFESAFKQVDQMGYGDYFMGFGKRRVRFVGHGIGLELDEYPFLGEGQDMALTSGMTMALEPKLIFPGKGVVGIENTFVLTEDGPEKITHFNEQINVV